MNKKKNINIGFRGWMLVIFQAVAFVTYQAFTNFPLNILSDMYGGAQKISTIYTVCAVIGVIVQLCLSSVVGKIKNMKVFAVLLGALSLLLGLGIMTIPPTNTLAWQICYGIENVVVLIYATFSVSILVGQWFPTRKGTIMGIATLAFPITNAFIGMFAKNVFKNGTPDVFGAFLPFFILFIIGWVIGIIFIKDYPEKCGCYRDNDRSITPEAANAMMLQEIENKKTTVWKIGHTLACRDFWLITIPMGALLMFSVGMMTQTAAIIGNYEAQLSFMGGYSGVMLLICIFGCIGSYSMGLLDTKFGTKSAVTIAVIFMLCAGILGIIPTTGTFLVSMICLAVFQGAGSNFTVSAAAQYWRREDFGSVYSCINPIANIICAIGPMTIAMLLYSRIGYQAVFIVTAVAAVISLILVCLFKPSHVKMVDDKYRAAAGKPLDDELSGRK